MRPFNIFVLFFFVGVVSSPVSEPGLFSSVFGSFYSSFGYCLSIQVSLLVLAIRSRRFCLGGKVTLLVAGFPLIVG